jgi:RNA polymerase sigma-70 factor (ECF subfamily)
MATVIVADITTKQSAERFEKMFREHYRFVYRTAYSMTGRAEDAEDVLQSLFLQLLRRELPPQLKDNPKPYLYKAAVNLSLNLIRSRKRLILTDSFEHAAVCRQPDDLQSRLLEAVAQLTPNAIEILILHYVHGYSDKEIAKLLGRSRGTIAVTLFRSRARLKKLIGDK